MAAVDTLLGAAVDAVTRSGALDAGALSGVVSAVGTDGTITVARGADIYPSVRLLSGYSEPAVGDTVQLLHTTGGWVSPGKWLTTNPNTWTALPLASNWVSYDSTQYYAPGYRRTSDNMVQFCGVAKPTASVARPSTIATLPTGFRPTRKCRFSCEVTSTSGVGVFGVIDVNTDGTVVLGDYAGNATFAMLDIVQFRLS